MEIHQVQPKQVPKNRRKSPRCICHQLNPLIGKEARGPKIAMGAKEDKIPAIDGQRLQFVICERVFYFRC